MLRVVKDYALYVYFTYKDDDLFRNGSIHEWWCLKTCKMSKVHACSREITNKPLRVRTTKTLCLPTWKTNYNAEKCVSDVTKMKNSRKQNFEGEANNMHLDKEDTWRNNFQRNYFAREAPTKSAVLYQSFFSETGLENSREIPTKLAIFSANLSLKIPRNLTFFPASYQKPCWYDIKRNYLIHYDLLNFWLLECTSGS